MNNKKVSKKLLDKAVRNILSLPKILWWKKVSKKKKNHKILDKYMIDLSRTINSNKLKGGNKLWHMKKK